MVQVAVVVLVRLARLVHQIQVVMAAQAKMCRLGSARVRTRRLSQAVVQVVVVPQVIRERLEAVAVVQSILLEVRTQAVVLVVVITRMVVLALCGSGSGLSYGTLRLAR
jgi:hypothetical protein